MPRSQQPHEGEKIIVDKILSNPNRRVLDVGCGDGKWSEYLKEKVNRLDGVEIWDDYITKYDLHSKYGTLYHANIFDLANIFNFYDIVILGDVLEHLKYKDANALINRLKWYNLIIYLTIPISKCIQDGTVYGNPYETHLYQWTHEELVVLGFKQLHEGYNPNGLVKIGTYEMICGT